MNKRFLLAAALCAAMNLSSFADETNLALNKTVVASSNTNANEAVDGNFGTRWEVKTEAEHQTGGVVEDGSYWLYVDLGEVQKFNTLRIQWEAGYAKKFKVLVADELDETTQQPKWKDEPIFTKEETLSNFNKYYAYFLDQTVSARYVKLQAVELGQAPYFSIWELGIYNLTEAEKTPVISTITTPKTMVAPGEEFTVNVEDQFGNAMNDITYTCSNAENLGDGKFKATTNGEVTITAKDNQGNEKTIKLTAYVATLTTVKVSPAFVVTGKETSLTFTVLDQEGKAITDYTTSLTDNKFTATEDGVHEITVKSGDVEKKVKVYAVSSVTDAPTLGANDMPIFMGNNEGLDTYNAGWEGGYTDNTLMDINGNTVSAVTEVATFGWQKAAITDTDYTNLEFDIYSTKDLDNVFVCYQDAGIDDKNFSVKAGEWKHVKLDIAGGTRYNSYIKFKLADENSAKVDRADVLLANVYLTKKAIEAGKYEVAEAADAKGFIAVKGEITAANVAGLKEYEGTAFDLTKAKIEDGVTKIEFKNPNALVMVAGNDKNFETADKLTDTNNVITTDGTYFFAAKKLSFDDANPIPTNVSIDTDNNTATTNGYEYTRKLTAGSWSTTTPLAATNVPENVEAYEIDPENSKDKEIVFKKATTLVGGTPYVLHATADATLTVAANDGDFNPTLTPSVVKAANVTFHGNYQAKKGTTAEYGLQNATVNDKNQLTFKKIGEGATIGTFRAYFTRNEGVDEATAFSIHFGGTTTGIGNVQEVKGNEKANGVYTIDGRKVSEGASLNNLPKGIYIVNGKKIVK